MSAKLVSIQVGKIQSFQDDEGKRWESAIKKTPITGPVSVGKMGLVGDEQSDLKHHGGIDKAVLAYSADHFEAWASERELGDANPWQPVAGAFGENLTFTGLTETDVCIGDVFQIGSCRLEVSQPRQPCWKLSLRWNLPKLAVRVQKTGRTGWYLRVITEGEVNNGDNVELIERPNSEWSIANANGVMYAKPRNANDDLALAKCPALSASWSEQLEQRGTKSLEKQN